MRGSPAKLPNNRRFHRLQRLGLPHDSARPSRRLSDSICPVIGGTSRLSGAELGIDWIQMGLNGYPVSNWVRKGSMTLFFPFPKKIIR